MVRRFGKVMSFSGRLNGGNGANNHNPVVPLSISNSNFDGGNDMPFMMSQSRISDDQKQILVQDLIECRSKLFQQSKAMKQLKEAHEVQLVALSRQLLELECGLRKRERELCSILKQRDGVIREQSHIIRFLTKKTGTKRRDILSLADEAVAKIPQIFPETKKMTKSKSEVALTSILESESENDSAVILDDLASPTSKSSSNVSRSVSDVMSSPELEEKSPPDHSSTPFASPNYRGFLLRHGSYERYKIRSRMNQIHHHHHPDGQYSAQVTANATLPRNKKGKTKPQEQLNPGKTVIVINGCHNENTTPKNSHRSVTKPRDVKNKSNSNRSGKMAKIPSPRNSPPAISFMEKFIQQSGSVYCSLYMSEEDEAVSYA